MGPGYWLSPIRPAGALLLAVANTQRFFLFLFDESACVPNLIHRW